MIFFNIIFCSLDYISVVSALFHCALLWSECVICEVKRNFYLYTFIICYYPESIFWVIELEKNFLHYIKKYIIDRDDKQHFFIVSDGQSDRTSKEYRN